MGTNKEDIDPLHPLEKHKTSEDRRDEIVEIRLMRGLGGMLGGFLLGASVIFVDKPTGKWIIAGSLVALGCSTYYVIRTVARKRRRKDD